MARGIVRHIRGSDCGDCSFDSCDDLFKIDFSKEDLDQGNAVGWGMEVPFGPFLGLPQFSTFWALENLWMIGLRHLLPILLFSFQEFNPFSVEEIIVSREDMLFLKL